MVYTIEGKWKYKEHDWIAGPGSVVYETAASTHTLEVVDGRRRRICAHAGSGDRRSPVPRRERQHRRARKLEDLGCSAILPIASSMASSRKTSRHSTDLNFMGTPDIPRGPRDTQCFAARRTRRSGHISTPAPAWVIAGHRQREDGCVCTEHAARVASRSLPPPEPLSDRKSPREGETRGLGSRP